MQASLYGLDDIEISQGKYKLIEPEIIIDINGIEVENPKYSLTASSSRPDLVIAEVISGDIVRLSASEKTGSADIRVAVRPLPNGDGTYKDFTVSVVEPSESQVLTSSKGSSGGCNSGFGGVIILFAGVYIVLLAIIKFGKRKESHN